MHWLFALVVVFLVRNFIRCHLELVHSVQAWLGTSRRDELGRGALHTAWRFCQSLRGAATNLRRRIDDPLPLFAWLPPAVHSRTSTSVLILRFHGWVMLWLAISFRSIAKEQRTVSRNRVSRLSG